MPVEGQRPKFAQLYIHDTDHEMENRLGTMKDNAGINLVILGRLIEMLDECNPYEKVLRSVRDRFQQSDYITVRLKLIGTRVKDGRLYNLPTVSEVPSLLVDEDEDSCCNKDIIIEECSGLLRRISELHASAVPTSIPPGRRWLQH